MKCLFHLRGHRTVDKKKIMRTCIISPKSCRPGLLLYRVCDGLKRYRFAMISLFCRGIPTTKTTTRFLLKTIHLLHWISHLLIQVPVKGGMMDLRLCFRRLDLFYLLDQKLVCFILLVHTHVELWCWLLSSWKTPCIWKTCCVCERIKSETR
jgi:hypothetical protein